VVVACVGGGSNFGGLTIPFLRRVLRDGARTRFVAAEPSACPTLTRGVYAYDFGDTRRPDPADADVPRSAMTSCPRPARRRPALPRRLAAGLRPRQGRSGRAARLPPERDLRGGRSLRPHRGDYSAPEPAHAIKAVIDEAEAAREAGEPRVILFGLCGHGNFDMSAYDAYLAGKLEDPEFSEDELNSALASLPEARR